MAQGNQPPADGITLRDVIDHMNHKFSLIEGRMGLLDEKLAQGIQKLEKRLEQSFTDAKRERAEILRRVEAEANAADDTLQNVVALTERVEVIEKHLALSEQK